MEILRRNIPARQGRWRKLKWRLISLVMKWRFVFLIMMFFLWTESAQAEEEFLVDYKSEQFKEVASQFICNCGCGQSQYDCDMSNCANSAVFKRELAELMLKGWDKDRIREYYVSMNGESILMAPQKEGFSLTVWIIPFAVLILGAGVIYFAVRRWVNRNQAEGQNPNTDVPVLSEESENTTMKSIIDNERKKYL